MSAELTIVLVLVVVVVGMLALTRLPADLVVLGALGVVVGCPVPSADTWRLGLIPPEQAIAGFANPGVITIGMLFIVAAGLRETGAVDWLTTRLVGRGKSLRSALVRLVVPVSACSAFFNNTPVVATLIPAMQDWSRRTGVSPSKVMIPLSYAAILGGMCSLVGTSSNLVVAGLVESETELGALRMFDVAWVGIPAAVLGGVFLVLVGPLFLPARRDPIAAFDDTREYVCELIVPGGSSLVGTSVEQAGLRSLPGGFLNEIERNGEILTAVSPTQIIREGDRLRFVGVVGAIQELAQSRELEIADDQVFKLDAPRYRRRLYETVVAPAAGLAETTIRAADFRNRYRGVVLAVSRNAERVRGKLGDIRIRGGDLLLVEADGDFERRAQRSRDFLLVRPLDHSTPKNHARAPISIAILVSMVVSVALGWVQMLPASIVAAAAVLATRCCSIRAARQSIDLSILFVIAGALSLGEVLQASGAASLLSDQLIWMLGNRPWLGLLAIYLVISVLTELVTNAAAVAIVFPIAQAVAHALGVDLMPFVIVMMIGASASFVTPLGYQTNLMVYSPGGYTFSDFFRLGLPMNLIVGVTAVGLTPLVFPF